MKEFKSFLRAGSTPVDKDEKPFIREAFRFAKVCDTFLRRINMDTDVYYADG
jgi:hypothetical protein